MDCSKVVFLMREFSPPCTVLLPCVCRVAPEFLQDTKRDAAFDEDEVPLIVFINARSGGRVGPELASVLARALGRSQVRLAAADSSNCVTNCHALWHAPKCARAPSRMLSLQAQQLPVEQCIHTAVKQHRPPAATYTLTRV